MINHEFSGQVALITGAGKGLGRAYALWLAARGCAVVVNNRVHAGMPSSAQAVVDEITAAGGTAIADEHGVESEAGATAMVELATSTFGKIDILICNAAVVPRAPFIDTPIGELRRVVDINLWGTLLPLHAAWRKMLAAGYGRVVLTSSSTSLYGHKDVAIYATTKSGMIGLARGLSREVPADADIKLNVVVPFAYTNAASEQMDAAYAETLSPDKVAPVVGWLAGDSCRDTGMVLHVGAGRAARIRILEAAPVDVALVGSEVWLRAINGPAHLDEAKSANQAGGRIARQ